MVVVQEVHNCLAVLSEVFVKRVFESQQQLQVMTMLLLVAVFKEGGSRCTHRRVPGSRWVGAGDDVGDVARCSLESFSQLRCLLRAWETD